MWVMDFRFVICVELDLGEGTNSEEEVLAVRDKIVLSNNENIIYTRLVKQITLAASSRWRRDLWEGPFSENEVTKSYSRDFEAFPH